MIEIGASIGRYHIIEQLGQGGMAVVYKAYDTRLDCDVAIKFIRSEKLNNLNTLHTIKRFKNEAQKTAQLTHPNIVPVIDYGEFEGTPYLVMKYISGGTLKHLIGKPFPYTEAARIIAPIARALEAAHRKNIVHRDVKPGNILITEDNEPMLSDFGIAKILESNETMDHTGLGIAIGTPEYMAPEQWEGKELDGRADIYALGVVFYELVTGRPPFKADTVPAVMVKALRDPLPRPKDLVPSIPISVERILFKALARDPKDRYPSMAVFADEIEKLTRLDTEPRPNPSRWKKYWLSFAISGFLIAIATGIYINKDAILERYANHNGDGSVVSASLDTAQPALNKTPDSNLLDIYTADFENGNTNGLNFINGNWSIADDEKGNHVLQVQGTENLDLRIAALTEDRPFTDGTISFDFCIKDYNLFPPTVKVVFRQKPEGQGFQLIFNSQNGTATLSKILDESSPKIKEIEFSKGKWMGVKIQATDNKIVVFINDEPVLSKISSASYSGKVLLIADNLGCVQFDNVKIEYR